MAMVIEGESLLNDGAAIVFFNVFLKLATTETGISGRIYLVLWCCFIKTRNTTNYIMLCYITLHDITLHGDWLLKDNWYDKWWHLICGNWNIIPCPSELNRDVFENVLWYTIMSRIYLCLRYTAREYNFRLLLRLKGKIPGWNSWRFQCIPDLIMLYNIWQCQNRPHLLYGYICTMWRQLQKWKHHCFFWESLIY